MKTPKITFGLPKINFSGTKINKPFANLNEPIQDAFVSTTNQKYHALIYLIVQLILLIFQLLP